MRKISEIPRPEMNSMPASTANSLPRAWVLAIFEKMRRRYLDLWTKKIGTSEAEIQAIADEWAEVLADLTPDDIRRGLDSWRSEYPPNACQFRNACQEPQRAPVAACHVVYKGLPILRPEDGLERLTGLRRAMAGSKETAERGEE